MALHPTLVAFLDAVEAYHRAPSGANAGRSDDAERGWRDAGFPRTATPEVVPPSAFNEDTGRDEVGFLMGNKAPQTGVHVQRQTPGPRVEGV